MKKFASLVLTVVLLATMFTVFAVPASAETKTAEDYLSEAEELENAGQYDDAAEFYRLAAEQYDQSGNRASSADAYMKAGECYEKANFFSMARWAFNEAAGRRDALGDYAAIAYAYMKAGEYYLKDGIFYEAGDCFSNAAEAAWSKANEQRTGSTLSEGSLTIIVGVACSVVFLAVGFFIGTKKKKKPAVASGENKDEE